MKKLILTILLGFSALIVMQAQNLAANDTGSLKIDRIILGLVLGNSLPNGDTIPNTVEVYMKIQHPELASKAYIAIKNKTTGGIIKQIEIDFIEEEGKIKYMQDKRKRDLQQNMWLVLGELGESNPEIINVEAYLVSKGGQQTERTYL